MFGRRRQLGPAGEAAARKFLRRAGLRILDQNYRVPLGEIDIIALDGETIVFVEVKTRSTTSLGDPTDNVHDHKRSQMTRAARQWLTAHRYPDRPYRFDVVAVSMPESGAPDVQHLIEAFIPPA